jgi:hypothetical protein
MEGRIAMIPLVLPVFLLAALRAYASPQSGAAVPSNNDGAYRMVSFRRACAKLESTVSPALDQGASSV